MKYACMHECTFVTHIGNMSGKIEIDMTLTTGCKLEPGMDASRSTCHRNASFFPALAKK